MVGHAVSPGRVPGFLYVIGSLIYCCSTSLLMHKTKYEEMCIDRFAIDE
jgi:hypothetical protein